jgi:hypothetical protein
MVAGQKSGSMSSLAFVYCGERHVVGPDEEFTFGRSGDLSLDDNPILHRLLGVCFQSREFWWLANIGAQIPMHVEGETGTTSIALSPGGSLPLVLGDMLVRFCAGGTSYELRLEVREQQGRDSGREFVPLSVDQLLLLVALAEPRLREGPDAGLPASEELIGRFGWSATRLHRKLFDLWLRFFPNLTDSADFESNLADVAIASGFVTVDQLSLLPPRDGNAKIAVLVDS